MHKEHYKTHLLIIIAVVVLANLPAVFGLDILLQDDNGRYSIVVNDEFRQTLPFRSFLGLRSELRWSMITVLSHSAPLARLMVLLLFMVPLSLLFYLFNRRVLELPAWVALSSAVIVQAVPSLYEIPAFVDAAYPVHGLLAFLAALWVARCYLEAPVARIALFAAWFLAWVLANDLMMEMGIFLFPALWYFVHASHGACGRKWGLYLSASLVVAARLFMYFNTLGHPHNMAQDLGPAEITGRIARSFEWWLPFSVDLEFIHVLLFLAVATALAIVYRGPLRKRLGGSGRKALLFYGAWFVCTAFPFWFLSKHIVPRYFYIPFFALNTIAMILVHALWIGRDGKRKKLAIAAMAAVLAGYGAARAWNTVRVFEPLNAERQFILEALKGERIDGETQIAMILPSHTTGGFYEWSSGYFQYLYRIPSLRGQLGPEFSFYDPFDPEECGFLSRMSCLDPARRLIAYRGDRKMRYFLQWDEAGNEASPWTLYRSHTSDSLEPLASGEGKNSYARYLDGQGIDSGEVLWGGLDR